MNENITEAEIAYCAGLYEGEGSIYCRKDRIAIRMAICMTDIEPLQFFQDFFDVGSMNGPYFKKNKEQRHFKPWYGLYINRIDEIRFVTDKIHNWLSPRRQEKINFAYEQYNSIAHNGTGLSYRGSSLKEIEIKEIREHYKKGDITQRELAEKYKVSKPVISKVINYRDRYADL